MAKRLKSGYISLLILAIVSVGVLIANGRPAPTTPTPASVSPNYLLFPFILDAQEIVSIEFVIPNAVPEDTIYFVLTQEMDGDWVLLRPDGTRPSVDSAQAQYATELVAFMFGVQAVSRNNRPMEDFGFLPNSKYAVRFQLNREISGQDLFGFEVGNKTPQGDGYYVAANVNSTIIDIVPTELIETLVMVMTQLAPTEALLEPTDTSVP